MSTDAAPLPDDVALCHQIIRELQREVAGTQGAVEPEFIELLEAALVRSTLGQACATEATHWKEAWWAART